MGVRSRHPMVNRDDMHDGGAELWRRNVHAVRGRTGAAVEVLISTRRQSGALRPSTPPVPKSWTTKSRRARLYPAVRPVAKYERSIDVILSTKNGC